VQFTSALQHRPPEEKDSFRSLLTRCVVDKLQRKTKFHGFIYRRAWDFERQKTGPLICCGTPAATRLLVHVISCGAVTCRSMRSGWRFLGWMQSL
jgi:hypothetical protein